MATKRTIKDTDQESPNPIITMFNKPIYTNKDIMAMLDCTEKTLRKYRNDGYIGFSRIGDEFYYTANDILNFLERTHTEPYQYS
jgi:hypothetical protein